MTEGWVGSSRK